MLRVEEKFVGIKVIKSDYSLTNQLFVPNYYVVNAGVNNRKRMKSETA
jgi:hypothetical protein